MAAAVALGAGTWFCLPWLLGDRVAPIVERGAAMREVAEARRAGAPQWSPEALTDAESRLQAAALALRRQELLPGPRRDFSDARAGFEGARVRALHARSQTLRRATLSRNGTRATVEGVAGWVEATRELTAALPLSKTSRRRLAVAIVRAEEARLLLAAGRHDAARASAEQAQADARKVRREAVDLSARFRDPGELARWGELKRRAIATSAKGSAILIDKDERSLTLYANGGAARRYRVEFGENALRRKVRQGDGATPEGAYRITAKKNSGQTRYHRALELDYPNAEDRGLLRSLKRAGTVHADAGPGSLIEIHGEGGRGWDWTRGCIAMANGDMDDLFSRVGVGTPVTIIGGSGHGKLTEVARALEEGQEIGRTAR